MALPRYLYSVTNSLRAPLISTSPSSLEQERELEGAVSVLHPSQDDDHLTTVPDDDGDGRFGNGVELEATGRTRSDIYTSARLAAAGISNPLTEAEREEEDALLGIHGLSYNDQTHADSSPKYGTYDDSPLIHRATPTVQGSRNSTYSSK